MSDPRIFIDADACPVKDEVYRVAARYSLTVFVVSNAFVNTPRESWIERVLVDAGSDGRTTGSRNAPDRAISW